jgi:hypothetical protein
VSDIVSGPGVLTSTLYLVGTELIKAQDYITFGKAKAKSYVFYNPSTIAIDGATHRKRGVRTGAPLGRLRVAK